MAIYSSVRVGQKNAEVKRAEREGERERRDRMSLPPLSLYPHSHSSITDSTRSYPTHPYHSTSPRSLRLPRTQTLSSSHSHSSPSLSRPFSQLGITFAAARKPHAGCSSSMAAAGATTLRAGIPTLCFHSSLLVVGSPLSVFGCLL